MDGDSSTEINDTSAESEGQDQTVHMCRLITKLTLHYLQNKSCHEQQDKCNLSVKYIINGWRFNNRN